MENGRWGSPICEQPRTIQSVRGVAAPIPVQRVEGQLTKLPDKRRRWQQFDTSARCVRMMSLMFND